MRRFNYTGRRDLKQSSVDLLLKNEKDGVIGIHAEVDLSSYGKWPDDAKVVLEAYDGPVFERLEIGPVKENKIIFQKPLQRFRGEHVPSFRLKVVSASSERGKLLGLCPVRPRKAQGETQSQSMLHVKVRPLDSEVYRLEIGENMHPVLVINERLPGDSDYAGKALVRHPFFVSMVLPQIFRAILTDIILVQDKRDADPEQPDGMWLNFARAMNPEELPDDEETDTVALREWIDTAVEAFAREKDVIGKFKFWSLK